MSEEKLFKGRLPGRVDIPTRPGDIEVTTVMSGIDKKRGRRKKVELSDEPAEAIIISERTSKDKEPIIIRKNPETPDIVIQTSEPAKSKKNKKRSSKEKTVTIISEPVVEPDEGDVLGGKSRFYGLEDDDVLSEPDSEEEDYQNNKTTSNPVSSSELEYFTKLDNNTIRLKAAGTVDTILEPAASMDVNKNKNHHLIGHRDASAKGQLVAQASSWPEAIYYQLAYGRIYNRRVYAVKSLTGDYWNIILGEVKSKGDF